MLADIVEWKPRKGIGLSFFRKSNSGYTLAAYHPPWSITWGWFLSLTKVDRKWGERGAFFRFHRYSHNSGGQATLDLFWSFSIRYHWQKLMRWPRAMQCTRCGERRGEGGYYCLRDKCPIPDGAAYRAAHKLFFEDNSNRRPS